MARPPDIPPDLIYDVLTDGPRVTATKAAEILTRLTGVKCSPVLVRAAINRNRCRTENCEDPECGKWHLGPAVAHRPPKINYQCEAMLGPIETHHRHADMWLMVKTYERLIRGDESAGTKVADRATRWARTRLETGTVLDYNAADGFYVRPCFPWDLGHVIRQPAPDNPEAQLALYSLMAGTDGIEVDGRAVRILDSHLSFWTLSKELEGSGWISGVLSGSAGSPAWRCTRPSQGKRPRPGWSPSWGPLPAASSPTWPSLPTAA